jgi:hypothetical protein
MHSAPCTAHVDEVQSIECSRSLAHHLYISDCLYISNKQKKTTKELKYFRTQRQSHGHTITNK